jgi:hypothetical protein
VPSLDDWEKEWDTKNAESRNLKVEMEQRTPEGGRQKTETTNDAKRMTEPKLLPVDCRSPLAVIAQSN